jgi:hypothetical protein
MAQEQTATPELTAEQKAALKKLSKVMPDAKLYEPRAGGNYYGPIVATDKNYVLQQVGENNVIAHSKSTLAIQSGFKPTVGQVVNVAHPKSAEVGVSNASLEAADPSRWQERVARTPASDEHTLAARAALGEKFSVFNAPAADKGLSPTYEGVIAAVTDEQLIQRINSRTAIVHHVGADIAKQFGEGQEAVVRYDNGQLKEVVPVERAKTQEQARPARVRDDQGRSATDADRAASWALAKNIVAKAHGSDIKMYAAERVGNGEGKFRGQIVALTDHHAVQRVGTANTFIAHSRDGLQGDLQVGRFKQINYAEGRGVVHQVQRAQGRAPAQDQERGAQAQRAPDRARQGQGMSR